MTNGPLGRSTVAEENIRAVARLQKKAAQQRTRLQCAADQLVGLVGRESTVAIHVVLFALWIGCNVGLGGIRPFDPFPFVFLTMVVSLEAIFLTLFVLATQNRMTMDADRRAHLDLQVNLLSEQEMTLRCRCCAKSAIISDSTKRPVPRNSSNWLDAPMWRHWPRMWNVQWTTRKSSARLPLTER